MMKLRKIRIGLSILCSAILTLFFLDFAECLPQSLHAFAQWQLMPAFIADSISILLFWLLLTLLLGRIYCSVMCPLGFYQDCISYLSTHIKKKRKVRFCYRPARNVLRYVLLVFTLIAGFMGFLLLPAALDPYSAYGRIMTHLVRPILLEANNLLATLSDAAGSYYFRVMEIPPIHWVSFGFAVLTLITVTIMAWRGGRNLCNTLCPVGAFLSLISRQSIWKVHINTDRCTNCGACGKRCKASCIDTQNHKIDYSRCVDCFDCIDQCREGAITFRKSRTNQIAMDFEDRPKHTARRRFFMTGLMSVVGGAGWLTKANSAVAIVEQKQGYRKKNPVAPPGSVGYDHLESHCTSCHLCISHCPEQILTPSVLDYGLGGLMQPMLTFEHGYCDVECHVCGHVCPNGAILPLDKARKRQTKIGEAVFVKKNCVILTDKVHCGNCARHCPVNAIVMRDEDGYRLPWVDTEKCIGCGSCEYHCPARPFSAIQVEGIKQHTLFSTLQQQN